MPKSLSVVVPAYNEESTLDEIVRRVLALPELLELIIVDDCSRDGTAAVADRLALEHPEIRVFHHPVNRGKTEALKTGFAMTRGDIVIVQDADLEYDPAEIEEVIAPIISGDADVVYGSRFLVRKASRVLYFYHYIANKGLTFLSNLCTNVNMTDVETCYKAFRGDIIRNMIITSSGFGFEIEVTAKVAKLKAAMYEVPISYYGRTYEQGKKIGMKDGFAALWYILRFNFLCSLENSFRKIPQLTGGRNRAKHAASRGADPDSDDSHGGAARAAQGHGKTLCLLAMLFFFLASCLFIPRIGTEDDELLFVPPIWHPTQALSFIFPPGRHPIPAMLMSYVGADKTLLYGPLVRHLLPSLWVLRLPVVLIGVLTLWILFIAIRRFTGGTVAAALVWLIATDSTFLLTTTFDWGPVAIQHLLLLAGFALLARPQPRVFAGALAFGLAFWDKGTAIWTIGAFAVSAMLFLPRRVFARISLRNAGYAAAGLLIGAWPVLTFNLSHHWATFTENTGFTAAGLNQKMLIMWLTLNGRGFFDFMFAGAAPHWYQLAPVSLVPALPLVFLERARPVRTLALFSLSTGIVIWLGMLFVRNGGTSLHHTILVWPWPYVYSLAVLGCVFGNSVAGKRAFAAFAVLLVASNIAMLGFYAQSAWRDGASMTWSDASLTLPRTWPGVRRVLTIDWGIYNVATFLSHGRTNIEDRAFGGLNEADLRNLDGTEFLSHVDGREVIAGVNAKFDAAISRIGETRRIDRIFTDTRGREVLMSFHCVPLARARPAP